MPHRKRALLALSAALGMIFTLLAMTSTPATAGGYVSAPLGNPPGSGPQSGTLSNGVDWSVDVGINGGAHGYSLFPGEVQTWTYSEPVLVTFTVGGLNCVGEGLELPGDAEAVTLAPNHTYDTTTSVVSAPAGAPVSDRSTFSLPTPVTSLTITAVGGAGCNRGITNQTVSAFRNQTPTASIAAPINGGVFAQGQTVLADYSCADGDTGHVDVVTCVGNVPDGSPIDTSTPGAKSFTVTATDEHGATSDQTVNYTVGDQAGLCSATAIGLPANVDLGVANGGQVPCTTRDGKVADFTLSLRALPFPLTALSPSVKVTLAEATTTRTGNTFSAGTRVADVKISFPLNTWSLEIKGLWSEVSASTPVNCAAGNDLQGKSEIGRIIRNGTHVYNQLSKPTSIALPLLGGVHFNQVVKTGTQVTANAVAIDLPGGLLDVNLGYATAGVDC
jgi:hypothetical protein